MSKEKKINVIGMDVFQTAAVKRNYMNVKPLIKERNKMEEKIAELSRNLEIKKAQIAANDQHTGMITKETCGIALTSCSSACSTVNYSYFRTGYVVLGAS